MQNIHDNDEVIVDLGTASVETQGSVRGDVDQIGLQLLAMGIADD